VPNPARDATPDDVQAAFEAIVSAPLAADLGASVGNVGLRRRLLHRLHVDGAALGARTYDLIGDARTATPGNDFRDDLVSGVTTAVGIADSEPAGLPTPTNEMWLALLAWLASRGFGGGPAVEDRGRRCRERMRSWGIEGLVRRAFRDLGLDADAARRRTAAVAAIHTLPMWRPDGVSDAPTVLASWRADRDARRALRLSPGRRAAPLDAGAFDWFVDWTAWVAAVRLVEYPPAYARAEPNVPHWVGRIAVALRAAESGRT
jgi:hypothetical protein